MNCLAKLTADVFIFYVHIKWPKSWLFQHSMAHAEERLNSLPLRENTDCFSVNLVRQKNIVPLKVIAFAT